MITDDDLRAVIAENEALEPGHPLRNDRSLEMARECLRSRYDIKALWRCATMRICPAGSNECAIRNECTNKCGRKEAR